MWWVMAQSCLPCLCSSCACSTRYHFVPHPSLATFNKPLRITLGAHNATLLQGFRCQGNRHPRRHPMTAQSRREEERKEGSDMPLPPVRSPGCTRPLALPQHTHTHTPLQWHTHINKTYKATVHLHTEKDTRVHQNTQARERNVQEVKEREEDSKLSDSESSSESVCVWLIEVIYVQSPVTPCMLHDFITL